MSANRLLALTVSAVLGIVGGVVSGSLLDRTHAVHDPLGLGVSLVDQACTGQSVLVTMASRSQAALASAVAEDPDHTRYLEIAGSCPTVWKQNATAHGYAAYLGPYTSVSQACQARMTVAHRGDVVTKLQNGATAPVQCLCYLDYVSLPLLRPGMDVTARDGIFVRGLQKLLYTLKLNPHDTETGLYDAATISQVRTFQGLDSLRQSGIVSPPTWHALQGKACKLYVG
ncbi:MAG TPA: peptidoglycan-binding domain-containing protein [Nocardioides sp.]|uniref:peptidoglycan-binding domain-containing protein n=1 Tax=Nocardioides sp. TaxID=35761 RepID=UPI002E30605D|nr:peptidoglycan-binding domain-containing protein [Nocardioides sp.]HEX3929839.1 peptidoglycan-binding domain-containing protein [Nocardioides sp.]